MDDSLGESAGGASTHFHVLSNESQKYFRYTIAMSGTAYNYWAISSAANHHLNLANKIAKDMNKVKQSSEELIEFLKIVPGDRLVTYASMEGILQRTIQPELTAVIESKFRKLFIFKR